MFNCDHYDLYGKMGPTFEHLVIEKPVGAAALAYEKWLNSYPSIAEQIHENILVRIE